MHYWFKKGENGLPEWTDDNYYKSKKHELRYFVVRNFFYPHRVTSLWQLLLPRLAEELVLDEEREGKHDDSLDEHG